MTYRAVQCPTRVVQIERNNISSIYYVTNCCRERGYPFDFSALIINFSKGRGNSDSHYSNGTTTTTTTTILYSAGQSVVPPCPATGGSGQGGNDEQQHIPCSLAHTIPGTAIASNRPAVRSHDLYAQEVARFRSFPVR